MQVPLLDLKAQYRTIREEIRGAVDDVLESQHFILGPKVLECEKQLAEYVSSRSTIGVSSGSDALLACLMAENYGPGDEVITTPFTFFATAGAIARVGAVPVFVDIEPKTYNIDPTKIEEKITSKTKAILPVHLYGQSADMDAIMSIARKHKLVVIEDAAQAIGTEFQGKRVGSFGEYGCFSFFPSKNLGCAGDGGLISVQDEYRDAKLRQIRLHGSKPKYFHGIIGGNFRLDAIQAAIVVVKLKYLDQWSESRAENSDRYRRLFEKAGLLEKVTLPYVRPGDRHIYNQFILRVAQKDRDALREHLNTAGIGTEIYYPKPMHLQDCFAYLGYQEGDCPESEAAALETFGIPIYPELTEEQQSYVADQVKEYYQ